MPGENLVDLYSVAGWFSNDHVPQFKGRPGAFGGYFKKHPNEGGIEGELIDVFGPSTINGSLDGDSLTFVKNYAQRGLGVRSSITYVMRRVEGNKFAGAWSTEENGDRATEPAECEITLVNNDSYRMITGPVIVPTQNKFNLPA
ncbi:MAG: hypothetical protein HY516_00160 [Candidatus Aenigmarchaeota archaeon]|nr:hypothetical protein [Candidatus Aenigmarchaeota archaeon]